MVVIRVEAMKHVESLQQNPLLLMSNMLQQPCMMSPAKPSSLPLPLLVSSNDSSPAPFPMDPETPPRHLHLLPSNSPFKDLPSTKVIPLIALSNVCAFGWRRLSRRENVIIEDVYNGGGNLFRRTIAGSIETTSLLF